MRKMKADAAKETALNLELNELIRLQNRRLKLVEKPILPRNVLLLPVRLIRVLFLNLRIKRTALRAGAIGEIFA
jgi:hypothetical protein